MERAPPKDAPSDPIHLAHGARTPGYQVGVELAKPVQPPERNPAKEAGLIETRGGPRHVIVIEMNPGLL